MGLFTKLAAVIFASVDGSGNARGAVMAECAEWGTEVERALAALGALGEEPRIVTASGAVTIADDDSRVHVKKTVEAATDVNFPSVADWIAVRGTTPFTLKNRMSNPALYPLTLILDGTDTLEDTASPLPIDHRQELAFWPDDSVTPNNWEIR